MVFGGGTMKPPSPCTGSAMTQAIFSGWKILSNPRRSSSAHSDSAGRVFQIQWTAVAVRVGDAVDLRRERAKILLVGRYLGRQTHGKVGPAVKGVLKSYDTGPTVAQRAIFTAFSTASAPELTK